jgi:uncharacterized protein (TIGR01244 family)
MIGIKTGRNAMSKINDIYNFLPLSDALLTGGQPTEVQFSAVAAAGVRTVINLALETSDHALKDEQKVVRQLGMEYIHIPVAWENPTREDLEKFMDAMDGHKDQKVLVHCAANMRVSAFVALYRVGRLGWTAEEAFKDVYRIWDPSSEGVWQEFINKILDKK